VLTCWCISVVFRARHFLGHFIVPLPIEASPVLRNVFN
jgi:hypothetical protein